MSAPVQLEEEPHKSEVSATHLDDEADRDELRGRYQTLLQELRVLLPGAQVLVAFMLTAPFSQRFADLDDTGRNVFGFALLSGIIAIVLFAAPTAFHRFGPRTDRARRLQWGIRMSQSGLLCLAASLIGAAFVVTRFVFSATAAYWASGFVLVSTVLLWIVVPIMGRSVDR